MNEIILEEVNCNLCNSNNYNQFLTRVDLNTKIPGKFRLVKCNQCGLIYQNPRPREDQFSFIYPENYDQYHFKKIPFPFISNYSYLKRLRKISKYKKNGNLLDIGCATGEFLNYVQINSKFNVMGLEPNSKAASFAKEQYHLNILNSTLEKMDLVPNQFDVITMWNVLEHLSDPKSSLTMINTILKTDGVLVFNTPILDSFDYKVFRKYWIGFELPRHFYIFSYSSINLLLESRNFRQIDISGLYGEHASFMSSFMFFIRGNLDSKIIQMVLEKFLFSLPIRVLFMPFFYVLEKFKKTSIPTFIYKKK